VVVAVRRTNQLFQLVEGIQGRAVRVALDELEAVCEVRIGLTDRDVLVNTAAGSWGEDPICGADLGKWNRMFALNMLGALRVTCALLPLLRWGSGGTIVNITSTATQADDDTAPTREEGVSRCLDADPLAKDLEHAAAFVHQAPLSCDAAEAPCPRA
jgi:NADP-dependent 3-hydroxy acid dehydrogenase YdfG